MPQTSPPIAAVSPPLAATALLSGAVLAYEVLLTRLFAIIQWHHFAYMVISLALLGYGASGSVLALLGERVGERFRSRFALNAGLSGVTAVVGFLLAQRVPFNPLEIGWDRGQLLKLLALYLLLALPFFCAANAFGLALLVCRERIHRIYASDLLGAGSGALAVILLLWWLSPEQALWLLGALGLVAAALALPAGRWRYRVLALAVTWLALATVLPAGWTGLRLSDYKGLSQALRAEGVETLAQRSGPLGWLTVLRNEQIPLRYAPGLSLVAPVLPPPQLGLFSDGNEAGAITRFDGDLGKLAYLDYLTSALPYHLVRQPRVLVLGAGGGADVLQALYHQASRVEAVELNPQVVDLVRGEFADFAGRLYDRPEVQVHLAEARGFVAASHDPYDLIQVALLDAYSSSAAGLYALSESYLYTVEAFEQYLQRLRPGGFLAITRWLQAPPRDSLKVLTTAVAALERRGVSHPGAQLALIRGFKTSTLLIKNGPFSRAEIAALRAFCWDRSFDPEWYPGLSVQELNRFNLQEQPYLHQGAMAILGPERDDFIARYKFDIRPASDDQPYFFRFFKWRTLPELLALPAGGGLGQLEWGYLVLVATLVQAVLAGLVLIVLPLLLGRRRRLPAARGRRGWVLLYFAALGLGFLFLEIAFIQKFVLFLSNPLSAVAVVLAAFLVFAGLGSGWAPRWGRWGITVAVTGIGTLALAYLWLLPQVMTWGLAWSAPVKIVVAVGLIAPLAFCMGMPFPLGLARLAAVAPGLLPWAWAINGCASVISAVLATLLAVEIGFSGVVILAVELYVLAALAGPRLTVREGG
jgi:SAM-dependent methyltransferase